MWGSISCLVGQRRAKEGVFYNTGVIISSGRLTELLISKEQGSKTYGYAKWLEIEEEHAHGSGRATTYTSRFRCC